MNEWIHFTGNGSEIRILKNCRLLKTGLLSTFGHLHGLISMWMQSGSKRIDIFVFYRWAERITISMNISKQ